MRQRNGPSFSRFAVVDAEAEAWTIDSKAHLYAYDGTRFWRRRRDSTRYVLIPAWKAPAFGWKHDEGCGCDLCSSDQARPAEVA